MSRNAKYEDQLKQSAKKAFKQLPPECEEEARAARDQLLNWLVHMDRITKNVGELIDDDIANIACNVFEELLTGKAAKAKKGKWANLLKAFKALTDDDQLNLLRATVGSTLLSESKNCALLARANDIELWENVGFHIDGGVQCAFAKVGRNKYQAIGFDNGKMYVGTEGSKTLWAREFGIAVILPFNPPFKVDKADLKEGVRPSTNHLTDKEREKIEEVLSWFEEDLLKSNELSAEDEAGRAELNDKMRETVKLARIRLPLLDTMLDDFLEENPESGENFQHLDAGQLVINCGEYLRMRMDDDTVSRQVEQTTLTVGKFHSERQKLIMTLIKGISDSMPKEEEVPQSTVLLERINEVVVALPAIGELLSEIDPTSNVMEAAKASLIWLQKELDTIPIVIPPTK